MFDFVKSERYSLFFSFVIGVGLMAVLKPACREADCATKKGANPEEVMNTTYQIANTCYQFGMRHVDCPSHGAIET